MKLFALPTWALTNALNPFLLPRGHPWRRWWTLEEWSSGQSPLCILFDWVFWNVVISAAFMLCLLRLA